MNHSAWIFESLSNRDNFALRTLYACWLSTVLLCSDRSQMILTSRTHGATISEDKKSSRSENVVFPGDGRVEAPGELGDGGRNVKLRNMRGRVTSCRK